jgi:hypothetical protein
MNTPDMALMAPTVNKHSSPDLRALTAELLASRRRLCDLDHLRTWNEDLRHRLWRAHVKAELVGLDDDEQADLEDEVALYRAALDMLEVAA